MESKLCLEPVSGDHGHYCHKAAGHVPTMPRKDWHSLEHAKATHVCNCHGMPELIWTKPGG